MADAMDYTSKINVEGHTRRNEHKKQIMNGSMMLTQKHQGFRNEQAQHMFMPENY